MSANSEQLPEPDFRQYYENQNKLPLEFYVKYAGKHVAFSLDGSGIVASGDSIDEVLDQLTAAGIHFSQVVHSYVDPPDVSLL